MKHFRDRRKFEHSARGNTTTFRALVAPLVALLALSAGAPATAAAEMVPDFALIDVNSTSSTYGQPVSPRDYLEQASGWYFGHAT